MKKIADFLAGMDQSISWHVSRLYPQYEMEDLESRPMNALNRAYEIGQEAGLRVDMGNVADRNNMYCH